MRKIKLNRYEKAIEEDLLKGHYVPVSQEEFNEMSQALEARKKNAVLNIRVNKYDLESLKQKAKKLGVKYQTFISEILQKVARA